jgi:hypothetical protein
MLKEPHKNPRYDASGQPKEKTSDNTKLPDISKEHHGGLPGNKKKDDRRK